jgi:hypothetical protein
MWLSIVGAHNLKCGSIRIIATTKHGSSRQEDWPLEAALEAHILLLVDIHLGHRSSQEPHSMDDVALEAKELGRPRVHVNRVSISCHPGIATAKV